MGLVSFGFHLLQWVLSALYSTYCNGTGQLWIPLIAMGLVSFGFHLSQWDWSALDSTYRNGTGQLWIPLIAMGPLLYDGKAWTGPNHHECSFPVSFPLYSGMNSYFPSLYEESVII